MLSEHIAFSIMAERQKHSHDKLHLYTLVDGLEYERLFQEEITQGETVFPLFIQPINQDVAFAGPWLVNIRLCAEDMQNRFLQLEQTYPSISWLISSFSFTSVFSHLESQLHLRLEDNRYALLRYYDPRVLNKLPTVLTPTQFTLFTLQIDEWLYYHNNHYYSLMTGQLS